MTQHISRKPGTAAIWLAIFLAGAAVGWYGYRAKRAEITAHLVEDARRAAVALDPANLRQVTGTRADLSTPAYLKLRERLQKLAAADPRILSVHLYRFVPETGLVVHLGDSTRAGSGDQALPGDSDSQPERRPGLREIVRTGKSGLDGPQAGEAGTWLSAYALADETPSRVPGVATKDIIAVDVGLVRWRRDLLVAAFQGALYVWILLGLPFGALVLSRWQGEQREVIRNLSEAMEQSHSAILILNLEDQVEYANRGLCRQMGYPRRELIGRNWREFRDPQTPEDVFADLFATVRAGRPWEGEWFTTRKDGTAYPVRGVVTPVKHRNHSLSCFVAVFDDVTETKRREAELREARDLAEAGDRAKGQFLATMSHEVRTPLNGIVGFTSLLLDTTLNTEQREYVQTIRSSGEALIQLTGDILDFARIESGKLKLDLLACDPRECMEEALDLLAARAAEKNIELLHRIGDDVPSAVLADGGRLRQVLGNLLGNAIKFTEKGEVEVTVAVQRDGEQGAGGGEQERSIMPANRANLDPSGDAAGGRDDPCSLLPAPSSSASRSVTLAFCVRDTGIGIPPEQHAQLFKPFSQLDDSSTRRYGGTGLGLAICRNLVQRMGGEIKVESQPGEGSRFTFTVRVAVAAPPPARPDLDGLHVGLAIRPGPLRRELVDLLTRWRAHVVEVERPEDLIATTWEVGLVAADEDVARDLAAHPEPIPGLPPQKLVGLVPISMASELRTSLRTHFRLLVNKPVHHGALSGLLLGSRTSTPFAGPPPTQFGFRVLVVEDDVMNQRLMQRVLTNLGCLHKVVENGRHAVEELTQRADEYDLVILDLHMPEMDGITALQEIRKGNAGARAQTLWIIALTADAREEERAHGLAAGLNDYLTKPLRMVEFQAALRRFRTERGARRR